MNPGKHHMGEHESASEYGKHHEAHTGGLSVPELLHRMVARGEAIRLAWRGDDAAHMTTHSDDFPTAVLPLIPGGLPTAQHFPSDRNS